MMTRRQSRATPTVPPAPRLQKRAAPATRESHKAKRSKSADPNPNPGISLIVDWENGIYSLGLGLSHWEWDEQLYGISFLQRSLLQYFEIEK